MILTIQNAVKDRGGFTHLQLTKPEGHTHTPGQYAILTFAAGDKPKYLAYASHTSEMQLLFVLRGDADKDTKITLSEPQGTGFRCDFADPAPMLFITHGTGISAMRPAMLERKKRGITGDTLLYGIGSAADEPELDCLRHDFGVSQLRAFSQAVPKAYVQDRAQSLDLKNFGAALLVGSKEMMASCRSALTEKGLPAERIFSNY